MELRIQTIPLCQAGSQHSQTASAGCHLHSMLDSCGYGARASLTQELFILVLPSTCNHSTSCYSSVGQVHECES